MYGYLISQLKSVNDTLIEFGTPQFQNHKKPGNIRKQYRDHIKSVVKLNNWLIDRLTEDQIYNKK